MTFSNLISLAIQKAGKQDHLAVVLDLAPSALSKRINGEVGWHEREINKLMEYCNSEIVDLTDASQKITTLKEALKIMMEDK